MDSE